ncbi:MAG TPA: hypothetical protein VJB70_01845 [Candidatus Paceibacterota bacterium]
MGRFLGIVALGVGLFLSTAHSASAFLGDFDPLFSKRPFVAWTVNGVEYRGVAMDIVMPTSEWVDSDGNTLASFAIRRIRNDGEGFLSIEGFKNGKLLFQNSSNETAVWTYTKDDRNDVIGIERVAVIRNTFATPTLEPCDPNEKGLCYGIETTHTLLSVTRDERGKITEGSMRTTWTTTKKEEFTKKQNLVVSYPDEDTMRVVFGGHGEPWAHPDKWHEYHKEPGGGVHWKACRSFFPGECPNLD